LLNSIDIELNQASSKSQGSFIPLKLESLQLYKDKSVSYASRTLGKLHRKVHNIIPENWIGFIHRDKGKENLW
jgi:hypothetical protein